MVNLMENVTTVEEMCRKKNLSIIKFAVKGVGGRKRKGKVGEVRGGKGGGNGRKVEGGEGWRGKGGGEGRKGDKKKKGSEGVREGNEEGSGEWEVRGGAG